MRWHAARTIGEESNRPAQRVEGEPLVNHVEVDRAYREWLKRRGLPATDSWFAKKTRKRYEPAAS
jgi:hypothetical protein